MLGCLCFFQLLAVSSTAVETAPAVRAAATMETACSTMEASATVEAAAPVKAFAAVEAAASTKALAMETATTVEAGTTAEAFAAEATTTLIEEAAIIETAPTTEAFAVKAAMKEAIPVAEAEATSETIPRSGADEEAAVEPVRAVVAVGRAGVGIIIVIAIGADRLGPIAVTDVGGRADADAEGYALGIGVRSGEQRNGECHAKQAEQFQVSHL